MNAMATIEQAWTGPDDAAFKDAVREDRAMFTAWNPDHPGADIRLSCLYIGWVAGRKSDRPSGKRPLTVEELRWLRDVCLGAMTCAEADGAPFGPAKQQEAARIFGFLGHDLGFPPRWHRRDPADVEPAVVDAPLHADAEVTKENATYAHQYPDGSEILVGPITLVKDQQHDACLQIQYVAKGFDDSQAQRDIMAYKERGDRVLHAMAMELHGDLAQLREQAPALFESIAEPTEPTVTVCDACLQASCWQGLHYCKAARGAGTVEKTRTELKALDLEHSDYWEAED